MELEEKKSNGALIGSIIIIIILIIGGVYIWQTNVQKAIEANKVQSGPVTPADADDLDMLEKDIDEIDSTIDIDVNGIN
jgi:hypothetical protein